MAKPDLPFARSSLDEADTAALRQAIEREELSKLTESHPQRLQLSQFLGSSESTLRAHNRFGSPAVAGRTST